jgi:hypothetical protein
MFPVYVCQVDTRTVVSCSGMEALSSSGQGQNRVYILPPFLKRVEIFDFSENKNDVYIGTEEALS